MDSVSTGSTNGLSLTISHTTSGADRLMLVGVSINNDNLETVTSITYNGISLSYVGSETQADDARVELWKLVAPPTGTYNVVITYSADLLRYAAAGVITLTGVNQATPLGSGSGFAAAWEFAHFAGKLQPPLKLPILALRSLCDGLASGVLGCETCTLVTFTAPAIQRWNVIAGSGNEIGAGATSAGASPSTTISAALSSSDHWAMGGVAIKPVAAGGPTATPTSTPTSTATATATATATNTPTATTQSPSGPAVDSVSTGSTNGLSLTISHTTSGTDRLMLVGVSINNDNLETVATVTYNGISLGYVGIETQAILHGEKTITTHNLG